MRFVSLFFIACFIVFAALQLNDPDPVQWTFAYLSAAFLCFLSYKNKLKRNLVFPAAALYVAFAIFLWPKKYEGVTGTMDEHPSIELARESLGLFICAVAVLSCYFLQRKSK